MKKTFPIQGIDCVGCVPKITDACLDIPWVEDCYVDVQEKSVSYTFDEEKVSPKDINKTLQKYWFSLILGSDWSTEDIQDANTSVEYRNLMISIPLVTMWLIDMFWMIWAGQWWREPMSEPLHEFFRNFLLASATIMLFVVWQKYLQAVRRYFRYWTVSMDTLVWLGTWVAYVYSFIVDSISEPLSKYIDTSMVYYEAVIVVIWFISLWKYLEHRTMTQSGQAIKALLSLQAKKAIRIDKDGTENEIDVEELRAWESIRIKSWEKVPLDCIITRWSADIDEAMITWEPLPVTKQEGDELIWGTVNINWSLIATITATSSDWYLAKIVDVVTVAQQSRPAIQALVDRIMKRFIPLVLCIAIWSTLVWLIFGQARVWDKHISIAVASFIGVLVIACPCWIWLATPMAVTTWVWHLAKNGILCKDARWLLKLRKAKSFIFDKTWTLTEWKPRVVAEQYYSDEDKIKEILYAIESQANHPLASAITDHLKDMVTGSLEVQDFTTHIGAWVSGKISWISYTIASPKRVRSNWYTLDEERITSYSTQAMTPICLVDENNVLAIFWLADTLKAEAVATVKEIQAQWKEAIIISWDHTDVVKAIAKQLWVTRRHAEVSPENKAELVQSISKKIIQDTDDCNDWCCPSEKKNLEVKETKNNDFVVMIGDGINDAPALAQADVWIAMSTGTDIAIESSDMTLLHGDISKLLKAIKISKLTHSAIVQNLARAFSYNVIWIPLAAWAFYLPFWLLLNPAFEWAAMAMSDLAVIGNSVRLQQKKI